MIFLGTGGHPPLANKKIGSVLDSVKISKPNFDEAVKRKNWCVMGLAIL